MKRFLCLLLCLCTIVSMMVMPAGAADYVNKIELSVIVPAAGFKPANATAKDTASVKVVDTQWEGNFAADGTYQKDEKYTITVTVGMKDGVDKYFKQSTNASNYKIGGKTATVVEHSYTKVVLRYTYTAAGGLNLAAVKTGVTEPVEGATPADATILTEQGLKISKTEWIGELNNGKFKAGVAYTARITVVPSMATSRLKVTDPTKVTVNGYQAAIVSNKATEVVLEYPFAPVASKVVAVADNGVLRNAQFYYNKPVVGDLPPTHISVAQSDALYISDIKWSGDFDENGRCMAKKTYGLSFQVNVKDGVDMIIPSSSNLKTRDYRLNGSTMTVDMTGRDGKTMVFHTNVSVELPSDIVDVTQYYTMEQADALSHEKNACDLIVNKAWVDAQVEKYGLVKFNSLLHGTESIVANALDVAEETKFATRILVDEPRDKEMRTSGGRWFSYCATVKELWLSPDMDIDRFLDSIEYSEVWSYEGRGPFTWDFTVYIPASKYPNGLIDDIVYSRPYRTLLYDGDVYQAFERAGKGEKVGREWCPGHAFTIKRISGDRVAKYPTCHTAFRYYYSCENCGQPEYNDKHTFLASYTGHVDSDVKGRIEHKLVQVIDPKHLIGKNADGDLVYAESCEYCGMNFAQIYRGEDMTEAEYKYLYGDNGLSRSQYVKLLEEEWEKRGKANALASTAKQSAVNYFVVDSDKAVTAKYSSWATNSVQWAGQENLLDKALLGNDYTKAVTRLQFCSILVKMAEELTGVTITPAPANTFTDTDNVYVRKAYAAGLTSGTGNGTFSPNATLTREQMATFMNNVFKYAPTVSNQRYSAYDSKLANYTDSNKISSWAKEPLARLNAYGLINGTSATTLAPTANCTIEQAIVVARAGLTAHEIGWYQCFEGNTYSYYFYWPNGTQMGTDNSYVNGDRVWVGAPRAGFLGQRIPVDGPNSDRTGTRVYAPADEFKPIRELRADDAERYYKYVPKDK